MTKMILVHVAIGVFVAAFVAEVMTRRRSGMVRGLLTGASEKSQAFGRALREGYDGTREGRT